MTPGRAGEVELRPETPQDAEFLRRLFAAVRGPALAAAGLPPAMLDQLLALQQRGQDLTYRAYPEVRFWIAWRAGERVGRLVEATVEGARRVVDIAVVPAHRREGLARAMLTPLIARARAAGAPVSARVDWDNLASRALFEQLGFATSGGPDDLQARLTLPAGEISRD